MIRRTAKEKLHTFLQSEILIIFPSFAAGHWHVTTSLKEQRGLWIGIASQFYPTSKGEGKEMTCTEGQPCIRCLTYILSRYLHSHPLKWVLLFPTYRWKNRIKEVKGSFQSLAARVWMGSGCITRPLDSEARIHPSLCQCSQPPALQGPRATRLWDMVRWSGTAGQGLRFPWKQDKANPHSTQGRCWLEPPVLPLAGFPQPLPFTKGENEAQQAYVNFTLISYIPSFFFLFSLCRFKEWSLQCRGIVCQWILCGLCGLIFFLSVNCLDLL